MNNKLNEEIKTLTGQAVMLDANSALTYKTALLLACETFNPQNKKPGDLLSAYRLGMKVLEATDNLALDDNEIAKLKEIVDTSSSFPAVVVGRLTDFINNIKKHE